MLKTSTIGLNRWQVKPIYELLEFLIDLQRRIYQPDSGDVLYWMLDRLDYLEYFKRYYGKGENSEEKTKVVTHFIEYAKNLKISPLGLVSKLDQMDTTQGKPEEEQILFTTIFRTKGLEFDYVLIPQCDENLLPYLKGVQLDTFDTKRVKPEIPMSTALENERRLFYVAITRARVGVLIGSSGIPSRFLQEIHLESTLPVHEKGGSFR